VTQDNIIKLSQPGTFSYPLTEVLRNGARAAAGAGRGGRVAASSAAMPTS